MSKITVFRNAESLQRALGGRGGRSQVGFVPTMGALHFGHLSLVKQALKECRQVVVSIFVNPTQFGPKEDYQRYPRNLSEDRKLLQRLGDIKIFAPETREVYPDGFTSSIKVGGTLGERFEAEFRPGHFDGVATVVARLFGLVRPERAYFGLKDFQQFRVIQRMTEDLCLPVKLVACETLRESDGLAMSSRNRYLSPTQRSKAPALYVALQLTRLALISGKSPTVAERIGKAFLRKKGGFRLQYLAVADAATLENPRPGKARVILAAAMLGTTHLIDNLKV